MNSQQTTIDQENTQFWNELCGSSLARSVGLIDASADSLHRFDDAYLAHYPYLPSYYERELLEGRPVLEIGLGYGTLSARLAELGADLYGVDIAAGPVAMARHRLQLLGKPADERIVQGSALDLPHPDRSFDYVYSIGCLHHTGDLQRAVSEVYRVLRLGGRAVVMLYHRHSLRYLVNVDLPRLLRRRRSDSEVRGLYDANAAGEAAPHTDYVSRREATAVFARFARVRIDARNFDNYRFVPRRVFLGNLDRALGLDLYIVADK